jgi:hypothetical protein
MPSPSLLSFRLFVDFANNGFGPAQSSDDLSSYLIRAESLQGLSDPDQQLAPAGGVCKLWLSNADQRFSPGLAGGPYAGQLLPNLPVRLQAVLQSGSSSQAYTLFTGYTDSWQPEVGQAECLLTCVDLLDTLARTPFSLPLRENEPSHAVVRHILNQTLAAPAATGRINFAGQPSPADWVQAAEQTYTYRNPPNPSIPNEIGLGATVEESIDNLVAAINGERNLRPDGGLRYTLGSGQPMAVRATARLTCYRAVLNSAPLRYYRLGESSGLSAADSGSNQRPAGLVGGTWGAGGPLADLNTALALDGVDDYLAVPALGLDQRPFSIVCWLRPDSSPAPFQDFFGAVAGGQLMLLRLLANGAIAFDYGTGFIQSAPAAVAFSAWQQVAATYDRASGQVSLYVNGLLKVSGPYAGFGGHNPEITFGVCAASGLYYKGRLGEAALYLRALTQPELAEQFAAASTGWGINLWATLRGAVGNSFALGSSGNGFSNNGPTLTGGQDRPADAQISTGEALFTVVGDTWQRDQTRAYEALRDVTQSEWGLAWLARDGRLHWRNRNYFLGQGGPTTLDLAGSGYSSQSLSGGASANAVQVSVSPRRITALGVIARANTVLAIPGQSGTRRFDPLDPIIINPGGGDRAIALRFYDPDTGQPGGAKQVQLPLVPYEDFTANELPDGSGIDYTTFAALSFTAALSAGEIVISVRNTALSVLYLTKLQVRGQLILRDAPVRFRADSAAAQAQFGLHPLSVSLPLPQSTLFAESLAAYLLAQKAYPRPQAHLVDLPLLDGQNPLLPAVISAEIGDSVRLEAAGPRYWLAGFGYKAQAGGTDARLGARLFLRERDGQTYGIFDDPVYGLFDSTLRFGL